MNKKGQLWISVLIAMVIVIVALISFNIDDLTGKATKNVIKEQVSIQKEDITEAKKPIEIKCYNECISDDCIGRSFVECQTDSEGCKKKVYRERVVGECGIECSEDSDCASTEECYYDQTCKRKDCGYAKKLEGTKCVDCGSKNEQCCDNNECSYGHVCSDGLCEHCGFYDEKCCESGDCSFGSCVEGICINEEDAGEWICSFNAYNCANFESWKQALEVWKYCNEKVGYDVHYLDGDNDGEPCEALM